MSTAYDRAVALYEATHLLSGDPDTNYLPKAGGEITGDLTVDGTSYLSNARVYADLTLPGPGQQIILDDANLYRSAADTLRTNDALIVDGTFTASGVVVGIDAVDVGLGNVTNVAQQPLDADLTTIAGLTATTDSFMQSKSSAWASRTIAQVKTDLAISNIDNTSDASKPVSTAQQTALDLKRTIPAAPDTADVLTSETTTSTTYTDLATSGPAVTLTLLSGANVLVFTSAKYTTTSGTGAVFSHAVSGSNTVAASDANGAENDNVTFVTDTRCTLHKAMSSGSTTFTMKYRAGSGATARFINRRIVVVIV
jgi:hypothetical protein